MKKNIPLEPVAEQLEHLLGQPVRFVRDWLDGVDISTDEILVLENVRFNVGEKNNDAGFRKKWRNYVMYS